MATSCRRRPDGAPSTAPKFFKIILHPESDTLRIPKEFTRRHRQNLRNRVFLKVPEGSAMEVELIQSSSDGETWLQKGWLQFKERYSIGFGYLLFFIYNGNSQFDVLIFDTTASEISYCVEGTQSQSESDDDSVVMLKSLQVPLDDEDCAYILGGEKSVKFYSEETERMYKHVALRPLLNERRLDLTQPGVQRLTQLLTDQEYLGTVMLAEPYDKELVYEFYSNMHPNFRNVESDGFGMSFVRGRIIRMTADGLNNILRTPSHDTRHLDEVDVDAICSVLTGGVVTHWPRNNAQIRVADLTALYAMLFKISMFNRIPTKHPSNIGKHQAILLYAVGNCVPVNFGHIIFNQIKMKAGSTSKYSLTFPCLVHHFLLAQGVQSPLRTRFEYPSRPITYAIAHVEQFLEETGKVAPRKEPSSGLTPTGNRIADFLRQEYNYHKESVARYESFFAYLAQIGQEGGVYFQASNAQCIVGGSTVKKATIEGSTVDGSSKGKFRTPNVKRIKIVEGGSIALRTSKAAEVPGKGKAKVKYVEVPDDEEDEE